MRGLEIGGGTHPITHQDFEQFDLHEWEELKGYKAFHRGDARDLSRFEDETFDEVLSSQTLEHFSWRETDQVLREWFRVVKVDGKLILFLPDIVGILSDYQSRKNTWNTFVERLYGSQDYQGNTHYAIFTKSVFPQQVKHILPNAELETIIDIADGGGFKAVLRRVIR